MGTAKAELAARLSELGIDAETSSHVLGLVPGTSIAVLLYGSRARHDHTPESDVDVLTLVDHPAGSKSAGGVNMSYYTRDQLRSSSGTLFGMHLRRDGRVVTDTNSELATILDGLGGPDPHLLMRRVHHFCTLLLVNQDEQYRHLTRLVRLSRYLLRSAIYGRAIKEGQPCFSVRELAVRFEDPELVELLSSHAPSDERATPEVLVALP